MSDELESAAGDTPFESALVIGAELMRRHSDDVRQLSPGWAEQLSDLAMLLDSHLAVVKNCRECRTPMGFDADGTVYLVLPDLIVGRKEEQ